MCWSSQYSPILPTTKCVRYTVDKIILMLRDQWLVLTCPFCRGRSGTRRGGTVLIWDNLVHAREARNAQRSSTTNCVDLGEATGAQSSSWTNCVQLGEAVLEVGEAYQNLLHTVRRGRMCMLEVGGASKHQRILYPQFVVERMCVWVGDLQTMKYPAEPFVHDELVCRDTKITVKIHLSYLRDCRDQ